MTRILGIDPGSQATGYGLVSAHRKGSTCLAQGVLRPPRGAALPDRLHAIHQGIVALIEEHQPHHVAVETAFYHRHPRSAIVLGHVRGVILLAARQAELPLEEYAPREVKMAITGSGGAGKDRVAFMVRGLLALRETPASDAADALAVALCHLHRARLGAGR